MQHAAKWIIVLALTALTYGCGNGGGGPGPDGDGDGDGDSDGDVDGDVDGDADADSDADEVPLCPGGTDGDGDGYGEGCPAGPDCDDTNPRVNPGATETCNGLDDDCDDEIDEGLLNECGNCSPDCNTFDLGDDPFPMPDEDPSAEADGTGRNDDGDIVLDETAIDFNYIWIANTSDLGAGTVSKIDTDTVAEVARYFSVTCFGNPSWSAGSCESVPNPGYSTAVQTTANSPSRTAVDVNFDVWVANRAFGGQASTTKIANSLRDCVDRNRNGVIDTSSDVDGNGHITTDCNGDGVPDDALTVCTDGLLRPEFVGLDDECVLMTVNYGQPDQLGRSVCLDGGSLDAADRGNVWVATNQPATSGATSNRFFHIDGATGEIMREVDLPPGHNPYGCIVDSEGILWAVSQAGAPSFPGRLVYFDTLDPVTRMGPVLQPGFATADAFYGIGLDSDDNIWAGGWGTSDVYRYRPDRTSFDALAAGTWTRIRTSELGVVVNVAGVAADLRGFIWAAANNGCILRIPQSVGDGDHAGSVAEWFSPSAGLECGLGGSMRGVGVDFAGNLWGISHDASTATRMDVDVAGAPTGEWWPLDVGSNPYTYSDFTGFGLRNFTRPHGTYSYTHEGCPPDSNTSWYRVEWTATVPDGTGLGLRVRSGETLADLGEWHGLWESSPALLSAPPEGPLVPNPARYLQVEFELTSESREESPVLHDYRVIWECESIIE